MYFGINLVCNNLFPPADIGKPGMFLKTIPQNCRILEIPPVILG